MRNFTEEQEIFRGAYRQFLQKEVLPHRKTWRDAGIVPRKMFRKMGENSYLLLWADERYGGLGIDDFRFQQIIMEEDAAYGEPGFYHTLHSRLVAPYIKNFGTAEQKARFLPKCVSGECILAVAMTEPDAGSDLAGMKSRAVDRGDHWVLNGAKTYISNGINADLVIVAAKTNPDNNRQIGLFLVERGMEGFERGRNLDKMGLPAQDTAELFFRDVKIPYENVLGDLRAGLSQSDVQPCGGTADRRDAISRQRAMRLQCHAGFRDAAQSVRPASVAVSEHTLQDGQSEDRTRSRAGVRRSLRCASQRQEAQLGDRSHGEAADKRT
ncbi:MAG: acyl-CoA dehydrogenase family protein [Rhizomicrobium sp.]